MRHREHVTGFLEDQGVYTAKADDVVIVYCVLTVDVAATAVTSSFCPNGDRANYLRDGLPTAELRRPIAASDAEHVLIIVNALLQRHAGGGPAPPAGRPDPIAATWTRSPSSSPRTSTNGPGSASSVPCSPR